MLAPFPFLILTSLTDSVAEIGPSASRSRAASSVAPSVGLPGETFRGSVSGASVLHLSSGSGSGSRPSSVLSFGSGTRRPRTYRDPTPDKIKYYARDGEMQAILSTAKHFYRCWLLAQNAFPSPAMQADVADKCYVESGGDPESTEPRAGECGVHCPPTRLTGLFSQGTQDAAGECAPFLKHTC